MSLTPRVAHARRLSPLIATAAAAMTVLFGGATAHAQCGGAGCLPGSGYTFDRYYDCGRFYGVQDCWYPGVLGYNSSNNHSWGWGSADWDGSGSLTVTVAGGTNVQSYFGSTGTNLARACYYTSCNDQDVRLLGISVGHVQSNTLRQVFGHAKA